MLPLSQIQSEQKPLLIHTIHEDDAVLLNTPDAEWFRVLYYFPGRNTAILVLSTMMRFMNLISKKSGRG